MECTKCGWAERVRAGAFKDRPWAEAPCARCALREDSTGTMAYDDGRPVEEEGYQGGEGTDEERSAPAGAAGAEADDGTDPLLPASVLADALRLFLSLPRDALDVIHLRYGGMPYREIAARLGVGTAAVEMRHKRVLESIPVLKELFPGKARKRALRRRERGKGEGSECGGARAVRAPTQ